MCNRPPAWSIAIRSPAFKPYDVDYFNSPLFGGQKKQPKQQK